MINKLSIGERSLDLVTAAPIQKLGSVIVELANLSARDLASLVERASGQEPPNTVLMNIAGSICVARLAQSGQHGVLDSIDLKKGATMAFPEFDPKHIDEVEWADTVALLR